MSGKRALVLGCGGVAGAAWSLPMLQALQQELQWDARKADVLIGTSAGAVLAALLASGVSVERMLASHHGEAIDCVWNHDQDSGGAAPPRPAWRFPALGLVAQGLRGRLSPFTALTGLLPEGRADMRPFMRLIDSVVNAGNWAPHPAAWMMVVDASSGERVALGRGDAPPAALNLAVCASYGVPGWCPPVEIAGRRYLDGGVASPVSADFLLGSGVDEAIVLAPMASSQPDSPSRYLARIERGVRRHMTRIVDHEVALLRQAGIRVVRLEPNAEALKAIGYNMMDPRRRLRVLAAAQREAPAAVRAALRAADA